MIKVAICDDEKYFLDLLENMIKNYNDRIGQNISVYKYTSAIQLMESLKQDFQIYFLDIKIPNMDGIELAKTIRKYDTWTYLVFITSFRQYMPVGYEVGAANYIEKPISQDELDRELNRALNYLQNYQQAYIPIKNLYGFYKVKLHNIKFIETFERKSLIHTDSGEIISYKNMMELEKELNGFSFFRCHNSYIVNINYIEKILGYDIYLITGEIIYTSKAKKKALLQRMADEIGCF